MDYDFYLLGYHHSIIDAQRRDEISIEQVRKLHQQIVNRLRGTKNLKIQHEIYDILLDGNRPESCINSALCYVHPEVADKYLTILSKSRHRIRIGRHILRKSFITPSLVERARRMLEVLHRHKYSEQTSDYFYTAYFEAICGLDFSLAMQTDLRTLSEGEGTRRYNFVIGAALSVCHPMVDETMFKAVQNLSEDYRHRSVVHYDPINFFAKLTSIDYNNSGNYLYLMVKYGILLKCMENPHIRDWICRISVILHRPQTCLSMMYFKDDLYGDHDPHPRVIAHCKKYGIPE